MVFREVEMLKSLSHKNIVKILNCYTLKNMEVIIVMEFLEGGELLEYVLDKGRLDEAEARIFFKQIIDAISYIHQEKLIHRDLKLENLLLASKNAKIIKVNCLDNYFLILINQLKLEQYYFIGCGFRYCRCQFEF